MRGVWHILLVFLLLAVIFNYPLFEELYYLSGSDWDVFFLPWHKITRDLILKDHVFPLWQPFPTPGPLMPGSGYPHFHNPETSIITPFILPHIFWGEVVGVKVSYTIHLAFGMLGMFLVSMYFNGKGVFNLLPPIVFMLSGHFVLHFTAGHSTWEAFSWFPLSFYFFLKSKEERFHVIYSAFFIALMLYEGGHHFIIWTFLFFGIYTAIDMIQERRWNYLSSLFLIPSLFIGLTASKLLPIFEMFHSYTARTLRGYEVSDLVFALFNRHQRMEAVRPLVDFSGGAGWWEYGAYMGMLPFLFGIIGFISSLRTPKRYIPLILTGFLFLLLSVKLPHSINLWEMLQRLPILESQRIPSRFIILFLFVLSVMSGKGLKYISELKMMQGKGLSLFSIIIILIVYIDLIYVNTPVYKWALREKTNINLQYRPSVDLKFSGDIEIKEYLPHRITFRVKTEGDNLLVLNQSYRPSWRVTEGKLVEYKEHKYAQGQMAVVLGRTDGEVMLYYSPRSFKAGIVLSLFTTLLCLFLIWRRSRK